MKKVTGQSPKNPRDSMTQIGNADCLSVAYCEPLLPVVSDYVHAFRCYDMDVVRIMSNYLYISCGLRWNPHVVRTQDFTIEELPKPSRQEWEESGIENNIRRVSNVADLYMMPSVQIDRALPSMDVYEIRLDGKCMGYYVPSMNSWVVTDWTWHIYYITYIASYVFPKCVEAFGIRPCQNSITSGISRPIPTNKIVVTMGCDPEFETKRNGEVVRSSEIIREHSGHDEIGLDGQCAQVEIRPKPGSPAQVTRDLRRLVKKFADTYQDVDLTTQGDAFPLGGHIHIGVGHQIEAESGLIQLLDDFIGRPTLGLSGDARHDYKRLSSVRGQPHGFEYRSAPSAIFQDPTISFLVFKIAKTLSEKYFNQEVMEYNDVPNIHDYVNVCGLSEKQAGMFFKFCLDYVPGKSVRAAWRVSEAKTKVVEQLRQESSSPRIRYRDDWSPVVRDEIDRNATLRAELTTRDATLTFYGLAERRGNMQCTLDVPGFTRHPSMGSTWDEHARVLTVGLSYDARHTMSESSRSALTASIIRYVRRI